MQTETLKLDQPVNGIKEVPVCRVHTLVIGSGAAGLNAALQLNRKGVQDVVIVTEGLQMGTSINTGSDKQTYYKLALCGADTDAPKVMAETYMAGGSMHGDLALVEASLSARAFLNLVNMGVPFPQDRYGQFVGYKTDHDPRQRATSIGPYTSRDMCRALIKEVQRCQIPIREGRVVVSLLTSGEGDQKRVVGAAALDEKGALELYEAENVVFAVGGPGGLYKTSVYPDVHTGAIGLGLMAGAAAQNLPESQYGLASIKFRWNVSGTYMQVVPKFISTAADGKSDAREFMGEYFDSVGAMNSMVFLKGYQWPFDSRKITGGSSIVDILVYIETVLRGRRVFLDFRANPQGFRFEDLSAEALQYLTNSKALLETPVARLQTMNPGAIELYKDHGIDVTTEPLEIAVCAQHNNGGLAGNLWWESTNMKHLFPVGEVNGSHGVYRPGGSALNSGQVGGFRVADYIAARYNTWTSKPESFLVAATGAVKEIAPLLGQHAATDWKAERGELQKRMSRAAAPIRSKDELKMAQTDAWAQWKRLSSAGCGGTTPSDVREALRNRQLCFAHAVYIEAVLFAIESGVGSRGSCIVLDPDGQRAHGKLDAAQWSFAAEDTSFRDKVLETIASLDDKVVSSWVPRRAMTESDAWFETAWAAYRNGQIYNA
jgi:succinate dehydrogenase/fumarate reductase flavoprotein subunit